MNKIKKYLNDHTRHQCFMLGVKAGLVIFGLMMLAYSLGIIK